MEAVLENTVTEQTFTCTFLGMLGDITIAWDEQNKEHIIEVIRKKMKEGYVFFTTKKYLFGQIKRKGQISDRDLRRGNLEDIIIPDEQFEKMIADMDDKDIAGLVVADKARVGKIKKGKEMEAMRKAKTPEEVAESNSVAMRPIQGG
ncbi:MAG: hypothetical protein HGA35_06275 [Erysipelotrichaceae bacterium]|nr:hypothetical protein [Erysipelotrichaceae bacterium]